jgi:hypothetical protein
VNAYDHQYRRRRAKLVATSQVCAICGGVLDKDGPPRGPLAPSVDHILSVRSTRGMGDRERREMLLDPAGWRVVHLKCNASRGDGRRDRPRHVSRDWR